tara:strand:- start:539 stop:2371 length:1833 start_codon:yes stop_codon:yes gene_type:complete
MARSRKLTVEVLADAKGFSKAMGDASKAGDSMGESFKNMGKKIGIGLGLAAGGAIVLGKGAIDAAMEAQSVQRKVEAVIKSTGGAANVSGKHINKFAESMSYKIGVDDEAIKTSAAMLLTFKAVRNESGKGNRIFDRAATSMMDLASVFGSSDAAAKQLGKALSDPVKGVSALKKAGVDFTDQQKAQIKTMVESGDLLGAQKLILGEVESQVGGTAAASATAGQKMKVAFGELQEKVGGLLLPVFEKFTTFVVEKLIPGLEKFWKEHAPQIRKAFEKIKEKVEPLVTVIRDGLVKAFHKVADFIKNNMDVVKTFFGVLAGVAVIAGIVSLGAAFVGLFNPVTLIVLAIAAVAAGLVYAYQHFEGFRDVIGSVIEYAKQAWPDIQQVFANVLTAIGVAFDVFVGVLKWAWSTFGDDIIKIATGIFNILKGVFDFFLGLFSGDWGRMWDGIVSVVSGIGGVLAGALGAAFEIVRAVVVGAFEGLWAGIKGILNLWIAGWENTINFVLKGVNLLIAAFNKIPGVPNVGRIENVHLPRLADGGIVTRPTTALIGEAGPEAIIPLRRGMGTGMGSTVNINVTASPLSSPADVGAAVVDALRAYERRNGSLRLRVS